MNNVYASPHINVEALADGELSEAEQRQALAHVQTCPVCQATLAEHRRLSALLQSASLPAVLPDASEFLSRLRPRLSPRALEDAPPHLGLRWLPPVIVLGGQALIQLVGLFVLALWLLGGLGPLLQQLGADSQIRLAGVHLGPIARSLLVQSTIGSVNGPLATLVGSLPWSEGMDLAVSFGIFALAFVLLGVIYLATLAAAWPAIRRNRGGVRHPNRT